MEKNIFRKFKANHSIIIALFKAIIEEDLPEVGSYLYIWENGIDKYDYLQDTINICKEQAFEDFGIPLESWEEIFEE